MAKKWFGKNLDRYLIGGIVIALIVISLTLWGPLRKFRPGDTRKPPQQAKQAETSVPKQRDQKSDKREDPGMKKRPESRLLGPGERSALVAIVIDDLGQDMKQAREIASLSKKITMAIMPGLPQSVKIAEMARQEKREVLIHLPMEHHSKGGKAAPGMLRNDMTPMEFLTTVSSDVDSVPGAIGINNHEGSSLTENKEAMKFLMAELKARNLLFLDSVTSPNSVAYATAKEFGLKAARRDVFLDNEGDNPVYIRKQLDELSESARKHGKAIGIGHPHPATISELRKWISEADKQGIEIVPVSRLMN